MIYLENPASHSIYYNYVRPAIAPGVVESGQSGAEGFCGKVLRVRKTIWSGAYPGRNSMDGE